MPSKNKDEYEYIGTFIRFFDELVKIIVKLFNALTGKGGDYELEKEY